MHESACFRFGECQVLRVLATRVDILVLPRGASAEEGKAPGPEQLLLRWSFEYRSMATPAVTRLANADLAGERGDLGTGVVKHHGRGSLAGAPEALVLHTAFGKSRAFRFSGGSAATFLSVLVGTALPALSILASHSCLSHSSPLCYRNEGAQQCPVFTPGVAFPCPLLLCVCGCVILPFLLFFFFLFLNCCRRRQRANVWASPSLWTLSHVRR